MCDEVVTLLSASAAKSVCLAGFGLSGYDSRPTANLTDMRQSRPDYGLGLSLFSGKGLETLLGSSYLARSRFHTLYRLGGPTGHVLDEYQRVQNDVLVTSNMNYKLELTADDDHCGQKKSSRCGRDQCINTFGRDQCIVCRTLVAAARLK